MINVESIGELGPAKAFLYKTILEKCKVNADSRPSMFEAREREKTTLLYMNTECDC